jgi:4-hydroxy-2-oxoglutarate aldolase
LGFYNGEMLLEGLFLPLTTPFFPDGRLNLRKLRQNVAHYSLTPTAGLVVLDTNSESELLSDAERHDVLLSVTEAASETKVLIAGVSRQSVIGTLALIDDAATVGYDVVLLRLPVSARLSAAEIRIYFETVADRTALPILLHGAIPQDLLIELASHPQVLGYVNGAGREIDLLDLLAQTSHVKRTVTVTQVFAAVTRRMLSDQAADGLISAESLGGGTSLAVGAAKATFKTRTKVVGFQVLAGGTEQMLGALVKGARGAVLPFAAAAPQGCYEVYAAWKDGDAGLAEEKQQRLVEAVRLVEDQLGVAGIKYGCDLNGYAGGMPRLPLLPLAGEQRTAIEEVMGGLKS